LVIWPVKIVPEMTYYVSSGTLNPTHSLTALHNKTYVTFTFVNGFRGMVVSSVSMNKDVF